MYTCTILIYGNREHICLQGRIRLVFHTLQGRIQRGLLVNLVSRLSGKIIKIVATRCQILRLKYTKSNFSWGSAPDHAGELSAPPVALRGPTSKGRGGDETPPLHAPFKWYFWIPPCTFLSLAWNLKTFEVYIITTKRQNYGTVRYPFWRWTVMESTLQLLLWHCWFWITTVAIHIKIFQFLWKLSG